MSAPRIATLRERLLGLIAQGGPMTLAQYMGAALYDPLSGYSARRAMLGADGDFITAPDVSQMFGELIGLWCARSWMDMGQPAPFQLVELGPGSGAMMADVRRATKIVPGFSEAAQIALVEFSAPLRERQQSALGDGAIWVTHLEEVADGPAIIVGNEFLDCLPIRQFVRTPDGWHERLVGAGESGALAFGLAPEALETDALIPAALRDAPAGSVAEIAPALPAFVARIAARLRAHGGRALFIDYGTPTTTAGDSLQAVRNHTKVDPLETPGAADLTAHVDFETLAALARAAGLDVAGPVAQGAWLSSLGIDARAAALAKARPDKAEVIARQHTRLTAPEEMGALFQAICLSAPGLPAPAGFEP